MVEFTQLSTWFPSCSFHPISHMAILSYPQIDTKKITPKPGLCALATPLGTKHVMRAFKGVADVNHTESQGQISRKLLWPEEHRINSIWQIITPKFLLQVYNNMKIFAKDSPALFHLCAGEQQCPPVSARAALREWGGNSGALGALHWAGSTWTEPDCFHRLQKMLFKQVGAVFFRTKMPDVLSLKWSGLFKR